MWNLKSKRKTFSSTSLIMAENSEKACYKLPLQIRGNLNIVCDSASTTIVLWSKYQILIYDRGDFRNIRGVIMLDFIAEKVLIHQNYLVCLDCTGNMNKNKIEICSRNQSEEELSRTFSICKEINIIACEIINTQYVASLQYKANKLKLFVNEFNLVFDYQNKFELDFPDQVSNEVREKHIMVSTIIKPEYLAQIKDIFDIKKCDLKHTLLIFTLDKINIYACFISNMMNKVQNENIKLIKIFTSSSNIVDIKITISSHICVLVGLAGGQIMKVRLVNVNNKPEVYHLNTPLYKFIVINDTFIYTDGLTMWKSENLLSNTEVSIHQFFVKNVKDFCVKGKKVICITFSNLIYTFFVDSNSSYVHSEDNDGCCSVEMVTNSDYLQKIMETVQKNEEQIRKINKESEFLTAISLSNRPDIMDSIINVNAKVYDNYMDVLQEKSELTLTDALNDYFDTQAYYFVITLCVSTVQHKLNKLLSNVLGDIKIHITIFRNKVLKTSTIQVTDQLKKKNFVISLKRNLLKTVSGVQVYIKIITSIPCQLDENQRQWNVLYRKCLDIDSIQFIQIPCFSNCVCLKADDDSLDTMINKRAEHLYGALYQFNNTSKEKNQISVSLKLPSNYEKILNNTVSYQDFLDSKKTEVLLQNCMKKFSSSNNIAELNVGNEKVVFIRNKDDLTLNISCSDIIIASDIRNLLAQIILPAYKDCQAGKEFVNLKLYTDIENLKRDIQKHRKSNQELIKLFSNFQSLIFGSLPI